MALLDAFLHRTDAGADFESDVPAGGDEAFDRRLHRVVGGLPEDSVSTSYPVSVTRMVCSHCADSERSFVTMVQPSVISRISRRPALTMGSIVNTMPGTSSSSVPGRP